MQSLWQDVRYGSRLMWRNPGFSLVAIVTLALGIGANSAIFSAVNALSLKPLPYHDPSRVTFVLAWDVEENVMRFNLHQAEYLHLQRGATSFQELAGYTYLSANLTGGDIPDRVQAYRVTPNTFTMLGVNALVGRAFDTREVDGGRTDIAVISHALWQRRFGGDAGVIGKQIVVNDEPKEIVAVMPPRFEFPVFNFKGDLWVPSQMRGWERGQREQFGGLTVVGRLRDGVAYAQAQSEVDLLMRGFAEPNRGMGARVIEMGKLGDMQAGPAAIILLVTVAMVLLLACANVANLLLARGAARQRELAVRAAIGASRLRIGRQMIVEGALLALGGGVFGVAIAYVALAAFRASLPDAGPDDGAECKCDRRRRRDTRIHAGGLRADERDHRGAAGVARIARSIRRRAQGIRVRGRQPQRAPAPFRARRRRGRARHHAAGCRGLAGAELHRLESGQSRLRPARRDDDGHDAAGIPLPRDRDPRSVLRTGAGADDGAARRGVGRLRQHAAVQHLR